MIYFVATPIGNLGDISFRAIDTLKNVDVIACEDTRKSMILLNHYKLQKRLISYHKHNESASSEGIIKLAKEGNDIAVISDCGMPVICDPGNVLLSKLKENNLEYTVVPGANAALTALLHSGFNAENFAFFGFVKENNKDRKNQLEKIKNFDGTAIVYSSVHNVQKDLLSLYDILGNKKICVVREITKMFEEKIFMNLGDETNFETKGEFVIVIDNSEGIKQFDITAKEHLFELIDSGMDKKQAIKEVALLYDMKKSDVYSYTI